MARKKKSEKELAVAKEIKDMEVSTKEEAAKSAPKQQTETVAESISFDVWWMGFIREVKIRPSYKEIIIADFKARGLSMKEKKETFDKAIKAFGL